MRCRSLLQRTMRRHGVRTAVLAAALALLAGASGRAAEPHPWCMIYQDMSGATACYYESYNQCRVSAAGGNGGICLQNPGYREPARSEPGALRKTRRPR